MLGYKQATPNGVFGLPEISVSKRGRSFVLLLSFSLLCQQFDEGGVFFRTGKEIERTEIVVTFGGGEGFVP